MTPVLAAVVLGRWFAAVDPDDPLGPVDQDPDAVRDTACRLVASDGVCRPAPRPPTRPPASDGGGGGFAVDFLSALLWVALIALLVALLVVIVRAALRHRPGARRRTADDEELDEELVPAVQVDHRREPVDWRNEADEHRRAGRYRDAVRCRYRALVGDLARRGVIDEIPGRTTGEERRQMDEVAPLAAPPFTAAADLFDEVWYGGEAVGAEGDERLAALDRRVLDQVPGHVRGEPR